MHEHVLKVALDVRGPFLTQATAAGAPGFDAVAARLDGRVMLPGSQVKGRLRDAWRALFDATADERFQPHRVRELLGAPSPREDSAANEPRRGRLLFDDFVAATAEDPSAPRFRIRIDEHRGAVEDRMLAAIETPFAAGRVVTFEGAVRWLGRQDEATVIEATLLAGLRFIDSFGANRSQGFGRLLDMRFESSARPLVATGDDPLPAATDAGAFELVLSSDKPLLLARLQPNRNLFLGDLVIPGAALKGALAATWRERLGRTPSGAVGPQLDPDRTELGEHFADVRFSHALLGGTRRPVAAPLSLVDAGGEQPQLFDVALLDGPGLIDGQAPAFAVDWKGDAQREAAKRFGWVEPKWRTRVRTAIDSGTRRAQDEGLFAYRTVQARKGQDFFARVDLSRVPDDVRPRVAQQLSSLLTSGLRHVGKTKASLEVRLEPAGSVFDAVGRHRAAPEDPLVLVLQTPALLADPARLEEQSTARDLFRAYAAAFAQLAEGARLVRFFSQESLAGGGYFRHRFQRGRPYFPFLLTEPGSVFVIERTRAAQEAAARWRTAGLPLPAWAVERYAGPVAGGAEAAGDDWRRCPFLPQNGYGEVAVDLETHWQLRPRAWQSVETVTGDIEEVTA